MNEKLLKLLKSFAVIIFLCGPVIYGLGYIRCELIARKANVYFVYGVTYGGCKLSNDFKTFVSPDELYILEREQKEQQERNRRNKIKIMP